MLEIEFCVLKKMEPPPIEKHLPTPLSGLNSCQTSSNYNVGNKKKKLRKKSMQGKGPGNKATEKPILCT